MDYSNPYQRGTVSGIIGGLLDTYVLAPARMKQALEFQNKTQEQRNNTFNDILSQISSRGGRSTQTPNANQVQIPQINNPQKDLTVDDLSPGQLARLGYSLGEEGMFKNFATNRTQLINRSLKDEAAMRRELLPKIIESGVPGNPELKTKKAFYPGRNSAVDIEGVTPFSTYSSKTNISMNPQYAMESAYSKTMGKHFADREIEMEQKMFHSADLARKAEAISSIADESDLYTGIAGEEVQALRKLGAALGLKIGENASAGDLIQNISGDIVLEKQTILSGPSSDKDIDLINEASPTLVKTSKGLKLISQAMANYANMEREMVEFVTASGGYNAQTAINLSREFQDRRILTPQMRKEISKIMQGDHDHDDNKLELHQTIKGLPEGAEELENGTYRIIRKNKSGQYEEVIIAPKNMMRP